ncbi:glycosyltransferase [Halorussus ruber]|uniref:glycosyltransferase n=1 Tax=Halorussus ruber TaxID=1126238 RepID=UPI0010932C28|nr:glycosyltransferase [Halorussus ruber]
MKVLQLVTERRPFFDAQVEALERAGVESTVCEVPGSHSAAEPRTAAEYARFSPKVLSALGDHDLIHAHYGLTAPFALALPRRPVVLTLWGTDLMGESEWIRRMSRFAAGLADATILPSRRMVETLDRPYTHVPFGIDTDRFRPIPRESARERVGWETEGDDGEDAKIVLFPYDTDRPEKDFPRAERVVERADADAEIRAITGVSHDEMPHYMNASDALLVTSTRESGPMVVKEAAACGLPVVSTDVGFVSDVPGASVCDSDEELAAELDRALAASDSAAADAESDRTAPELPRKWELDATGRRLRGVYERVLSERGATGDNLYIANQNVSIFNTNLNMSESETNTSEPDSGGIT